MNDLYNTTMKNFISPIFEERISTQTSYNNLAEKFYYMKLVLLSENGKTLSDQQRETSKKNAEWKIFEKIHKKEILQMFLDPIFSTKNEKLILQKKKKPQGKLFDI